MDLKTPEAPVGFLGALGHEILLHGSAFVVHRSNFPLVLCPESFLSL